MKTAWFLIALLACWQTVSGQPPEMPRFEVASITLNEPRRGPSQVSCQGSRFGAVNTPLSEVLRWAYEIGPWQLSGTPRWAEEAYYTIQAIAAGPIGEPACKRMVQRLFEERFQLVLRRQEEQMAAYHLIVLPQGAKFVPQPGVTRPGSGVILNGYPLGGPEGITMARLAEVLSLVPFVARPVLDKTGLTGTYSFRLDFARAPDDNASDVFTAVGEQLGLKLEPVNAVVPVFAVQRMERPSDN